MRQLCEPKEIGADGAWATISWSIAGLIGSPGGFWPCQPCCPFIEPRLYWGVSNVMTPILSALATSIPPWAGSEVARPLVPFCSSTATEGLPGLTIRC